MADAGSAIGGRALVPDDLGLDDLEKMSSSGSPSRYRRDSRSSDVVGAGTYGYNPTSAIPSKGDMGTSEKKMTAIEQGKERGQITASAAMSVVSVAMLRTVLDSSEDDKYYKWRLGLVSTALILQVFCGLLSLYVAFLRNYYSKFQDDFLKDCLKSCCSWRCRRKRQPNTEKESLLNRNNNTGCCPFECSDGDEYDFENQIALQYDRVREKLVISDIETADFEYEIKWLVETVARLNADLNKYEKTDVTDEESNYEYVSKIKDQLQQAQLKKEELEQKNRENKRLTVQASILETHVEELLKEKVLKRATFWQNLLNVLFYVVFVLSAIIAGLGITSQNAAV